MGWFGGIDLGPESVPIALVYNVLKTGQHVKPMRPLSYSSINLFTIEYVEK